MVGTIFPMREHDSNEICIENIGPKERQKRLIFGLQGLAVGFVIALALIYFGVEWYWRLGLFIIFTAAMTGIFQARERT